MIPRALALVALLAGCTVTPIDLYPEAARSAADGRLLRALALLEQIPSAHPRRPDCERLTREVQARIIRGHLQIGEALQMSAAGESTAASALLAAVRADWSDAPGLGEALAECLVASQVPAAPAAEISADPGTGTMGASVAPVTDAGVETAPGNQLTPIVDAVPDLPRPPDVAVEPARALPLVVIGAASPESAPERETATDPEPTPGEPLDIAMLRGLVHSRDLPAAIARLDAAQRAQPDNQEVVDLLTGLLRKRALAAYGRGWLQAAIDDWARVHDLCPGDRTVSSHLTAARTELAQRAFSAPRGRINAGG